MNGILAWEKRRLIKLLAIPLGCPKTLAKSLGMSLLFLMTLPVGQAMGATCTSKASGSWNSASTWNCTSGSTPAAGDTVILASPYTVSLNGNNRTAAALTINVGATLNDDGQDLTVTGNVVNNGTFGTNGGALIMRGTNATISGTGTFNDTDVQADASGISIPSGSTMSFTNGAQLRVGRDNPGTFTLNGTIDGTGLASGDRIVRVYDGSSATINGTINAPNAYIRVEQNASLTNNGSVTVQYLDSDGNNPTSVWTQGANSSLVLSQTPSNKWLGTLNASAASNTVTYNGAAQTVYLPTGSTYSNLTLSGGGAKTVPTGLTIAGNFTMSGTATTTAPAALTVGGNFSIGAGNTFTSDTGTVTLNGAAAQTISSPNPVSFNNLTVTNGASPNITLATNVTVAGTLSGTVTLTSTCPTDYTLTSNGGATVQHSCSAPPAPLASYHMDEASWNGTANEVADSSGNVNHAQAFNSANTVSTTPAIAGSPGTCRYGVFDGGGITRGYIQTPLSNLTTNFTITAWIRTTNNSVPGQRILIDDQSNSGGYGFSLGDGGAGKLRLYSRAIAPVIFDSPYTITNNTWYFVATVVNTTLKKRSIYVFNQVGALLSASTEAAAYTGTWGTDNGPVSIGAETNASGESPATFHFHGNIDEVQVFQSALTQTQLGIIATQTHACLANVPDHLVIQSSGSGLTCASSTLTLLACQDASCAIPYTLGVSGTLSATGAPTVNWDGTTGGAAGAGFVIPSGSSSVTKNVQVATAGSVVFGISSAMPTPTSTTTCNFGSPACTFSANTAGFIYSNSTTGSSYTIPSLVSGIAATGLYLRAVQASTTNPAVCTPAIISQTTAVNMGYVCNNPATCQAGNLATINATAITSGGTAVNLNFDANGSAPITARYDDVGQITLNANKTVTPFGGATAVALNGSSNAFVVKPHHFDLSGIQQTASPFLVNPAAADATGNKFVKAGEQFSVTVTARNFLNAATPNFGKETSAESVKLTPALMAPAGGNNPVTGGNFGAFTGGVATGTAFTWNEVGIITLTPSVGDADYLGAGDTTGTASGNVGRFIPDHFTLLAGSLANRGGACTPASGFTYLDEALNLQFTLTAEKTGGGATQNYDGVLGGGGFAKLAPGTFLNYGVGARSSTTNLTSRISGSISGTPAWSSGVLSAVTASVTATARSVPVYDGPWTATQFGIAPSDSDGTQLLAGALNFDVDNNAVNDHQTVGATTELRFGRLRMLNAYGSELLALPVPIETQYWNGSAFARNTQDSCTQVASGNIGLANYSGNLASGETTVTVGGAFAAGLGSLSLSAPGATNSGSVDLVINLGSTATEAPCVTLTPDPVTSGANLGYLRGKWCGASYDRDPVARATFGIYKTPVIYLRENY